MRLTSDWPWWADALVILLIVAWGLASIYVRYLEIKWHHSGMKRTLVAALQELVMKGKDKKTELDRGGEEEDTPERDMIADWDKRKKDGDA